MLVPMDPGEIKRRPRKELVQTLRESQIFREYQAAFLATFGLPLSLVAGDGSDAAVRDPLPNGFCGLRAAAGRPCPGCGGMPAGVNLLTGAGLEGTACAAGFKEVTVPVYVGETLVAFLMSDRVLLRKPTRHAFRTASKALGRNLPARDRRCLEAAYFGAPVLRPRGYRALCVMLSVFAQYLTAISNQLMIAGDALEPTVVTRIRRHVAEHIGEQITLGQAARAVNFSVPHFCRIFREATGLTFNAYLARVRVAKAMALLRSPRPNISEAAYGAGFQSLSQFNRTFRRVAGHSPTVWREKLNGPSRTPGESLAGTVAKVEGKRMRQRPAALNRGPVGRRLG